MIDFTSITNQIKELLEDFQVKDLPNMPNVSGIFEQSELSLAIISGSVSGDYLNLTINISIASPYRIEAGGDDCCRINDNLSLNEMISAVIYKLHRKKIVGGGILLLESLENFTPESGKWRSLLSFRLPIYLIYEGNDKEECFKE